MPSTYAVYHYKNWKKSGGISVLIFTLAPAILIILGRLLFIKIGYNESAIDNTLKSLSPILILAYIAMYIYLIAFAMKKKNDQIIIQNNTISIQNKNVLLKNCQISYGKSGVPGATGATGTICYLSDGINIIKVCTPKLYEQEYKYTKGWSYKQDIYMMNENIYTKFIEDLITKFHCKEESNDINITSKTKQGVIVELLRGKYKMLPYYYSAVIIGGLLCVFFTLLLKLDNIPSPLYLLVVLVAILLVRYKKRKFKNYFLEIDHHILSLKKRTSGKDVFTTPIDTVASDIFYIHYTTKGFEVTNTILKLRLPQFATLRIATSGNQMAFHPKRKWKWLGSFYTYHYIIDNASWNRLAKALTSVSYATFN